MVMHDTIQPRLAANLTERDPCAPRLETRLEKVAAWTQIAATGDCVLPFLFTVMYGGRKCRAVIDTGATICALSRAWQQKQRALRVRERQLAVALSVQAADASPMLVHSEAVGLVRFGEGPATELSAKVMPQLLSGVDLIVGLVQAAPGGVEFEDLHDDLRGRGQEASSARRQVPGCACRRCCVGLELGGNCGWHGCGCG